MEFIIVGLLILELVAGFAAFAFLRGDREDRFYAAQTWLNEVNTKLNSIKDSLDQDAETRRRVEQLLEDAGTRAEEEAAMSKAMEEGISNLLGYSVGKGPGAAT